MREWASFRLIDCTKYYKGDEDYFKNKHAVPFLIFFYQCFENINSFNLDYRGTGDEEEF